jgi:hypothetical protein
MSPVRCFAVLLFSLVVVAVAVPAKAQRASSAERVTFTSFPGEAAPRASRLDTLLQQIRWDTRRTGDQNPDGLRLRFEKIAAQGNDAAEPAQYRVFAEGAPENKVYTLGVWFIGKGLLYRHENIYLNTQGLLMRHKPTPDEETAMRAPGDEVVLIPETTSAEPVRYVLLSIDNQLSIQGTLVPHPVVGQDQECTLEARIAEPGSTAILIVADGFPAEARLALVLESEGSVAHLDFTTDENGHAEVADFPSVPGKAQGSLLITAEASDCLPSVRLPWGATISAKAP